jgi:outer membrane PBP1 activator LpoA protein
MTILLVKVAADWGVRFRSSYGQASLAFLAAVALAGCASNAPTTSTDWKARAEARSVQYWNHVFASKFDEAYALLTPGSRQAIASDAYALQMKGLRAVSAKLDKSKCTEESICTLDLKMEVQIRVPRVGFRTVPLDHQEVWTLSNGEMYLIRK